MSNNRQRIKDLKNKIISEQSALLDFLSLNKDKSQDDSTITKDGIAVHKANITSLKEELKLARKNKNNSSFFEFIPSLPNRRMRREMRKLSITKRK